MLRHLADSPSPGIVDNAAANTMCTTASDGVERLKGAYERASMALTADGFSNVLSSPQPSREIQFSHSQDGSPQSTMVCSALGQCSRMQEKVLRDISMLRQDVLSSKHEPQAWAEATRNWTLAQAHLAKESIDVLIQLTEDQKLLKEELKQEATLRAQMAENIAKDREMVDAEIVSSIKRVVEQGAGFREVVLKEAGEQRAVLAKEIQATFEISWEKRLTEMQLFVDELSATHQKDVASLSQRCDSHEGVLVQALADGLAARCSTLEKKSATLESGIEALKQQCLDQRIDERLERSEEALAVLAENLKEDVRERTHLSSCIHEEVVERTKVVSAVWLEVANVQSELRGSLLNDLRRQVEDWKENISASLEKHKVDLSALRGHVTEHMTLAAIAHETAAKELKQAMSRSEERIEELSVLVTHKRSSASISVSRQQTPIPQRPLVARSSSLVSQSSLPSRQGGGASPMHDRGCGTPGMPTSTAMRHTATSQWEATVPQRQVASPMSERGRGTPRKPCGTLPQPPSQGGCGTLPQPPSVVVSKSCCAPTGVGDTVRQLQRNGSYTGTLTTPSTAGTISPFPSPPGSSSMEGSASGGTISHTIQRVPSTSLLSARFGAAVLNRTDSRRQLGSG